MSPQQKPQFVYHGSPRGDIQEFIPRISKGSGERYGAQVYASNDIATACIFMSNIGRSWSAGEANGITYVIIPLTKEEFLKQNKIGYLYKLPAETFTSDPQRGMGDKEWASSVPVKPIDVTQIDSVLDTMIEHGVQVYFVTDALYQEMRSSREPNWTFLKSIRSENQERGIHVKSFGN